MLRTLFLVTVAFLVAGSFAHAKIINPITLEQVLKDQPIIFTAKISDVLPDKPGMIFVPVNKLRGEFPFERVPVNLAGDAEAKKEKQTDILLERVEKDTVLVIFGSLIGKTYRGFAFTNGTWFGMIGTIEQQDGNDVTRWRFTHTEPYFRRTFKGTTDELIKVVQDGLKGGKLPAYEAKEEPGYGPPLKKAAPTRKPKEGQPTAFVEVPIGVIQLPFLGLIAALAALFPALFGGLAIFMKRWVAALSAASFVSMLVAIQTYFPHWLAWSGISDLKTVWFVAGGLCAVAALWAGYRYRRAIREGRSEEYQPRYLDRVGLSLMVLLVVIGLAVGHGLNESLKESPWLELVVLLVPLVACSYFVLAHWCRFGGDEAKPVGISAESVGLWAGLLACVVAGSQFRAPTVAMNLTATATNSNIKLDDAPLWVFQPKEAGEVLASPVVTKDRVFVNVHHRQGFVQYGRVYALDRESGKELWSFDNDGELKPLFCSPVFADGKLYFGEGYHTDRDSKLYCLDASNGKKLWEFSTTSHTESTPTVGEGKVVFGAGDDGVYCLNATTGEKLWQHKGQTTLHVDSNPLIHQGRVYAGSGTSTQNKVNRIFCLDLNTGDEIWGERVEYSAWGSPSANGSYVYFATGNGTYSEDKPPIAGMVLCRDAATGKPVWERGLPNSVVARPALDRYQLYIGCRDGSCYALDRFNGEIIWKQTLGSPVLAAPTLSIMPDKRAEAVYVLGSTGTMLALSPTDGAIFWGTDFRAVVQKGHVNTVAIPALVRTTTDDKPTRRLFIGLGFADTAASSPTARLYCYQDRSE